MTAAELVAVSAGYSLLKDYTDAAKWLAVVTGWKPKIRLAWYYLGRALYSDTDYNGAAKAFKQVLLLNPLYVAAETSLELIYEAQGDDPHAV